MSSIDELRATLERIANLLDSFEIPFHCTGGVAVSCHGDPRSTQDIDIVLRVSPESITCRHLVQALKDQYGADVESVEKGIRAHGMFQVIDAEYFIKIDFYNREMIPGELDRSVREEIYPGFYAMVACREDAILSKLMWIEKGSSRSRRDVVNMFRNPKPLDWVGLRTRASLLGVGDLLENLYQRSLQPPVSDETDL